MDIVFKERERRAVVNVTLVKVGLCSYACTMTKSDTFLIQKRHIDMGD